ncbi:MAG: hypothetical protein IPH72_23950 [Sandaracinaceae bacterium]|nr:hypothetical protein [Sandaracinaceae bacterium]
MKTMVDGVCAGYLDSWWSIQPAGSTDWTDHPVEAQVAHLFAQQISGALGVSSRKPGSTEPRLVPVCEGRYRHWRPEPDESLSDASGRADVWAPDVHTPSAPAGWFIEVKLADVREGKPKIGRQPWAKIVDGFVLDVRKLLLHSVPSETDAAHLGGAAARCSFVVVVKGAESAFEALLEAAPYSDGESARGGKALRTFGDAKKAIRDEVRAGEARQPGSERVRRFFHGAQAALGTLEGVEDVTLTASDVQVLDGHQAQVVAISWLQSVPIEHK